jgi:hypothetical protein
MGPGLRRDDPVDGHDDAKNSVSPRAEAGAQLEMYPFQLSVEGIANIKSDTFNEKPIHADR